MVIITLRNKAGDTAALAVKRVRFSGTSLILDEDDKRFLKLMDGKWRASPEVRRQTGHGIWQEIVIS